MKRILELAGLAVLALVALSTPVIMTGCDWDTDLLNWIPIGVSAVNGVLSLLAGAGIVLGPGVVAIIGLIQAGLTDLKLAVVEYQSTTPPPVGRRQRTRPSPAGRWARTNSIFCPKPKVQEGPRHS